jgi:hypothetical protein
LSDEDEGVFFEALEGIGNALLQMNAIDEEHESPGVMSLELHYINGKRLSVFLTVNPEQAAAILSALPPYEVVQ